MSSSGPLVFMFDRFEVGKCRNSQRSRTLFPDFVTKLYILRDKTQHAKTISLENICSHYCVCSWNEIECKHALS